MKYILVLVVVFIFLSENILAFINQSLQKPSIRSARRPLNSKGTGDDAVSRRRKRRGKIIDNGSEQVQQTIDVKADTSSSSDVFKGDAFTTETGTSSLEDLFGLGNDQLKELMEQELPVPREDLITGKALSEEKRDKNKVFKLPDLTDFVKEDTKQVAAATKADSANRIDRSNEEEYLRVLQLNPFADADDSLFLDEYDMIPSIFGSGKLLNIPVPYLQTGHGILLIVTLLGAFVYAPGNPLTEFPPEIRNFFKQGLAVTYSINIVLALQAFFNAKSKNLPAIFWAAKTLLLGGVAYYEVTRAKDPTKMNNAFEDSNPSDRKSKRRNM